MYRASQKSVPRHIFKILPWIEVRILDVARSITHLHVRAVITSGKIGLIACETVDLRIFVSRIREDDQSAIWRPILLSSGPTNCENA